MNNYTRGRRYEYEIKRLFEQDGYTITRASASKSPFDLVATKRTASGIRETWIVCLMQCKIKKRRRKK